MLLDTGGRNAVVGPRPGSLRVVVHRVNRPPLRDLIEPRQIESSFHRPV